MRTLTTWLGAAVLAVTVHAQDFTRTMTADEQAAAGLEKLSPAELAKLKAFVERYKTGAVAVVQEQAEQKVAATEAKVQQVREQVAATEAKARAAEQKAAQAEAKAKEAEAKSATAAATEKKKGPGWLSALTTLKRIADKPEGVEAMESRIAGPFTGWSGKTTFRLQNGQVWQQNDDGSYVDREVDSPAVRIVPGRMGVFWMEVEGVNPRVKVKPIKLE
jgi:lipoprotein-anchoring transpeptidase ErfK/SrfK